MRNFSQPEGNGIAISADVADDRGVNQVWAIIYPPSYVPPTRDSEAGLVEGMDENLENIIELVDGEGENLERVLLERQNNDVYRGVADNFTESGTYRIVIHADDSDGLIAQPVVLEYSQTRIHLPFISR